MAIYLIPAAAAAIIALAFLLLMSGRIESDSERRKKAVLGQVSQGATQNAPAPEVENISLLKDLPPGAGLLTGLPGVQSTIDLLLKSGLWHKRSIYLLACVLVFVVALLLLQKFHFKLAGFIMAGIAAYWFPRKYLRNRIQKRNGAFLNLFPDTVDMIVRSVKSGHPLNTAMRMIVENMENPIREEFKQVVDEVSYGRTLPEALSRMASRIDEPDLNFFVVVLSVQQETGGSLAEVLTNLSGIIRKRRQLRLKIRALTSEGRATSYILGALPVVEFTGLYFITPSYLDPLFDTFAGNIVLGISASLIVGAIWIVNRMVNIDI